MFPRSKGAGDCASADHSDLQPPNDQKTQNQLIGGFGKERKRILVGVILARK
jgi:hypothetical protein